MRRLSAAAIALILALPAAALEDQRLAAVIGTDGVYFTMAGLKRAKLFMLLFNEGTDPVEPIKMTARLYIDGQPADQEAVRAMFQDGPPGEGWKHLEPGAHFQFGIRLDLVLDRPGLHRIVWKGDDFASNEVRVLVAPDRPKGPHRTRTKSPGAKPGRPLH